METLPTCFLPQHLFLQQGLVNIIHRNDWSCQYCRTAWLRNVSFSLGFTVPHNTFPGEKPEFVLLAVTELRLWRSHPLCWGWGTQSWGQNIQFSLLARGARQRFYWLVWDRGKGIYEYQTPTLVYIAWAWAVPVNGKHDPSQTSNPSKFLRQCNRWGRFCTMLRLEEVLIHIWDWFLCIPGWRGLIRHNLIWKIKDRPMREYKCEHCDTTPWWRGREAVVLPLLFAAYQLCLIYE